MIFDEMFARHPNLRVISMGTRLLVTLMVAAVGFHSKLVKTQTRIFRAAIWTAKRHLKVSPFAGEPVGWIIENVGPDMLVFARLPPPRGDG